MRLFYVCLHALPNKEDYGRQHPDQYHRVINALLAKGVTESLKAADQMEWVRA